MNVKSQGLINHDVNRYQKSIAVLPNASKIFIRHHSDISPYRDLRLERRMKKIQLWVYQARHAHWAPYFNVTVPCGFIHLWQHLFTYETLFLD